MDQLYLSVFTCDSETIEVSLESLITLFIYHHGGCKTFDINLVLEEQSTAVPKFRVYSECVFKLIKQSELPQHVTFCVLPVALVQDVQVISGLCSVVRQIVLTYEESDELRKLLGFRDACLAACNESSIWTKFCEIDVINTIKDICMNLKNFINDTVSIPRDLTRFENHMAQPVRIHNVYKVAQDSAKRQNKKVSDVNTTIKKEELGLSHRYSEGPFLTLADIILFPSIHIAVSIFSKEIIEKHLPLTFEWYTNMKHISDNFRFDAPQSGIDLTGRTVVQEDIQRQSLYISDPQRYQPRNRIYTRQADVLNVLGLVDELPIQIKTEPYPAQDSEFNWSEIPAEGKPQGGALPLSRMQRKCEQLESLAKVVMAVATPGQTIVDFCSGSGHLGILLAIKLPRCRLILLENKEKSMSRARARVNSLKLANVVFLQCNLDYFVGSFDIGVSLHACGVATDLVIQHCVRRKVAFVSSPCCYGAVHDCHHITYPRSILFRGSLTPHYYLVLGHAADQTHDANNVKTKQGIHCMNIVDTDRKLQAQEHGYRVTLTKMTPESCTPKNNILIGLPDESFYFVQNNDNDR